MARTAWEPPTWPNIGSRLGLGLIRPGQAQIRPAPDGIGPDGGVKGRPDQEKRWAGEPVVEAALYTCVRGRMRSASALSFSDAACCNPCPIPPLPFVDDDLTTMVTCSSTAELGDLPVDTAMPAAALGGGRLLKMPYPIMPSTASTMPHSLRTLMGSCQYIQPASSTMTVLAVAQHLEAGRAEAAQAHELADVDGDGDRARPHDQAQAAGADRVAEHPRAAHCLVDEGSRHEQQHALDGSCVRQQLHGGEVVLALHRPAQDLLHARGDDEMAAMSRPRGLMLMSVTVTMPTPAMTTRMLRMVGMLNLRFSQIASTPHT
eukprot:CAMPEP_0202870504 /NCGR_PEP_ID=MMETSP1391-20130828/15903_1 /ASSEMBLY_ACC=CAM_ASM_000867 /TAXON_ID=1034604 /ORGANISM="Chlamydomonas leiostraca, Strain SAG 11-49" /LENGTH=317 /DNA_ID=CAMNT_0049551087 /DNA_START=306 /DNA_END=1259 /DNA_ORIENTATION=+